MLIVASAAISLAQESPANHSATAKTSLRSAPKKSSDTFTLVGAGDIVGCSDLSGAQATAKLIDAIPGTVFAAGDLAYQHGTYEEFVKCYGPTWGRFKARTRPTPGNHEYNGATAIGYFRYWDGRAGDPGKGYYSYDLGMWHIVVLNTNCGSKELGGCAEGSPEETWLKQELAAHPAACTLAYGHHALFSSGLLPKHAEHPELRALWQDLYDAHADLILRDTNIPTSDSPRKIPKAIPIPSMASAKLSSAQEEEVTRRSDTQNPTAKSVMTRPTAF
jgi:hypothetical protein